MERIDHSILTVNKAICDNIEALAPDHRGLLSQNILSQLRTLVEHVALKIYSAGRDLDVTYDNIKIGISHIKKHGQYRVLSKFHYFLQIVASHYTLDSENSERLMLKYYEYLLRLKILLHDQYGLDILENIDKFPLHTDKCLVEYYEKIVEQLSLPSYTRTKSSYKERFYIQKIHPFFVKNQIYYEVTFVTATDNVSKFNRLIAFTRCDILPNYAVRLELSNANINVMGKNMPIQIIDNWEVSIRPCEFNNFASIFGPHNKLKHNAEALSLMKMMTCEMMNLVDVIDLSDAAFLHLKASLIQNSKTVKLQIWSLIERCREICKAKAPASNILRYLLYHLNNKIIKQQIGKEECGFLSHLYFKHGVKPFDEMPFNTSPIGHNPKLQDLFECISIEGRECEFLARIIRNNTEVHGILYSPKHEFQFDDIEQLIQDYNDRLYAGHKPRRNIEQYKSHLYINEYEEDTYQIIRRLKELSCQGISNYSNSVDIWLRTNTYTIDCDEKRDALRSMFSHSKVALIYGSAGTGKSTQINHISNFFKDNSKIYLANTNPAIDNLRRKVNAANSSFMTITKFLSRVNSNTECDILFIDECSTVSNADMIKVLQKATFKLLVLVGDIYQIESISFGNWFAVAKSAVPNTSVFELKHPYRSSNNQLQEFWDKVRNNSDDILEHIARNNYSVSLDESIFQSQDKDEIILCLNYDGLYGINNINRFLQSSNTNPSVQWGPHVYKVGDPILFNESNRFAPLIYNNLKGEIYSIEKNDDEILFSIEVYDIPINEMDAENFGFELVDVSANNNAIIRFQVNRLRSTDDDDESSDTVVPFQIAYAVSIHKAQGLEYNSVKVVITNEVEELITHNIFYTAITRAKKSLKIYWTPETEQKILSSLTPKFNSRDYGLLKSKYPELAN